MKIALLLIIIIFVLLSAIFFASKPLTAGAKVLLLLSQEFPQVPIKPLHKITQEPKTEKVRIEKKIIGDLLIPRGKNKMPALIVAMGVKTSDKDRRVLLDFCETLSRLGYVVLWPRLEDLEKDVVKFEEPQTFIDAFEYLENLEFVDKKRISYVGFSVGSSLTIVAAEDEKINSKVRSVVFFGGYYSILDYLTALSTKKVTLDGQTIKWNPHESAIDHAQEILVKEGLWLDMLNKESSPDPTSTKRLLRFSPDQKINALKANIFILHEKSDAFVPYTESIKLKKALEDEGKVLVYYQANLFEHVQPKKEMSYEIVIEFLGLFDFLHKVFMYL